MNARVQLGLLLVLTLSVRVTLAQDWNSVQQTSHSGIVPAGFHHSHGSANLDVCPPDVLAQTVYELVPDHQELFCDTDTRLNLHALENLHGAFFRLEYMIGEIENHSGRALGAPINRVAGNPQFGLQDVSQDFELTRPFDLATLTQLAPTNVTVRVPDTRSIQWDGINGVKGTIGIPIRKGFSLEGSAWGLEENSDSIKLPSLPPTKIIPLGTTTPLVQQSAFGRERVELFATTLTTNGRPADAIVQTIDPLLLIPVGSRTTSNIILYDESFRSNYQVDTWTTDVNMVYDLRIPNDGWRLQSMLGFRHSEFGEDLVFGGSFNNGSNVFDQNTQTTGQDGFFADLGVPGPLGTSVTNQIRSKVRNYRNELQVGMRSEWSWKMLTFGVEPKVGLGANLVRNKVYASNVREPGDNLIVDDPVNRIDDPALTVTSDREITFSPTVDLGLNASAQLTDWFKVRAGYNIVWMGRVSVADGSIKFDQLVDPLTGTSAANVVLDRNYADRLITAFTIGGEILLP